MYKWRKLIEETFSDRAVKKMTRKGKGTQEQTEEDRCRSDRKDIIHFSAQNH